MMDPFASLIPDARAFLRDLSAHNTRDWFMANKARYDVELKTPATLLMDQVGNDLARATGWSLTPKLFRAHRDVRFSKEKTPYHTHLHMLWTISNDAGQAPGLFFGIAPDYVTAGGGLMQFDKPVLARWRAALDGPFGDALAARLDGLAQQGLTPRAPDLARVPAPYGADHAHGDLLRHKGFALWRALPDSSHDAPLAALHNTFTTLKPMIDDLQTALA